MSTEMFLRYMQYKSDLAFVYVRRGYWIEPMTYTEWRDVGLYLEQSGEAK